jgi:hypothetical protein
MKNLENRKLSISSEIKLLHSERSIENSISDINMLNQDIRALLKIKKVVRSKSSQNILKSRVISLGYDLNINNSNLSNNDKTIQTEFSTVKKEKKSVSFKNDFSNIIEIEKDVFRINEDNNNIKCSKFCDCLIF